MFLICCPGPYEQSSHLCFAKMNYYDRSNIDPAGYFQHCQPCSFSLQPCAVIPRPDKGPRKEKAGGVKSYAYALLLCILKGHFS